MRKQYHFRPSPNGLYAWDVDQLIYLANLIEVKEISLSLIEELNESYWFDQGYEPTCMTIAEHAQLIYNADLSYPIILCPEGRIMDGMHRVCKAYINGHKYIRIKQFSKMPKPDYVDITPDQLNYA